MNLNHGLRNFFGYMKDALKANEILNQTKVKILFLIFLGINAVSLIYASSIFQNLIDGKMYNNMLEAAKTFFNNPNLLTQANQDKVFISFVDTFSPFVNVFFDLFVLNVLNYLPYFLLSLLSLLYCRELMIHHLPFHKSGIKRSRNVFFKALLMQLLIMPLALFTISGTDYFSIIAFPFLNSLYWFFVFFLFDENPEVKGFGTAFKLAVSLFKNRFLQLILLVIMFQLLSSFLVIGIRMLFDSFNKPFLTASIHAFVLAALQFISIRFLFHVYKDIKYPELLKEKEKEDENYDD